MAGSQTTENLVKIKTSEEKNKKVTLWKDERGYEVRVFEEKENQVARVYTEFKNNSEKEVVMEMLAASGKILERLCQKNRKIRQCGIHACKKIFSFSGTGGL